MHDVAVIGAGPAGIAASIYLKRAGINVTLFEKDKIGGLLLNAHLVENYPGFPAGIEGSQLCKLMEKHLKNWNIKIIKEEVKQITTQDNSFILETQKLKTIFKTVIIATGTKPKNLDISINGDLHGSQVFYEIKDLLSKIKTKETCVIIGGGDAAFDYALNLANKNVHVDIFYRGRKPKCLPLLEKRATKSEQITIHQSFTPLKINKINDKLEITFRSNKKTYKTISNFLLIACGRNPNTELINKNYKENIIPGLFIAGDVRTGEFRQTGIAVGAGISTAMRIEEFLRGKE